MLLWQLASRWRSSRVWKSWGKTRQMLAYCFPYCHTCHTFCADGGRTLMCQHANSSTPCKSVASLCFTHLSHVISHFLIPPPTFCAAPAGVHPPRLHPHHAGRGDHQDGRHEPSGPAGGLGLLHPAATSSSTVSRHCRFGVGNRQGAFAPQLLICLVDQLEASGYSTLQQPAAVL